MADILSFRDDQHQSTEMLLPWYAAGQLEGQDRAAVEAHLDACSQCRAALERERRLKTEIGALPLRPDLGWKKLERRLAPDRRARRREVHRGQRRWTDIGWPAALAAFTGAQVVMLAFAMLLSRPVPPADYRTLGAQTARANGTILILFRPDSRERDLRVALARADARLVDGPTAAGAYVLDVEPGQRDAALARLRAERSILLAQPIETGAPR
jgi:anti-sigma-K factor RskA